jgi:predicted nucleic acid-binding protein
MRYLLDTSALLIHYRQETGWEATQDLFRDLESDILIASPTLAEFARRLHTLGADDADIQLVLDQYGLLFTRVLPIHAAIARAAYSIGRQATSRLPLIDALIAAAAQSEGAILVHRDTHMATIPLETVPQLVL